MEKSEPALAPEWLKGTGNISGGGNTSHHPAPSLSHSDDHASILSSRNRSSFSIGDYDSPRHSERNLSSHFRRSISSNGSSLHGKDSSSFPRSYSSFKSPRDKDYDKDFLDFHDRERSSLADHRIRDYSDPMGISHTLLSSRIEKDTLRRSRSMISGKRGEVWPKRTALLNNSKTNSHIISNGVNVGGTTVLNNIHKTTFDRDFPSLGAEERQGVPEIGRVSSPGLGSAAQSLSMGTSAVLTDCWTSALVEPPPTVGSNNIVLSSAQQSSTVNLSIQAPTSLSTVRNMAETVAQAPPRARAAPQLSVETQRLEELAIKQSRQLIPVTPSIPKALVLNSEKQKPKATGRIELTMANKIGQQQQLASNHHVHTPLQAGPTRPDAAKTSFLVLKPTREKNGISPTTKEGSSPTNANRVVANNPLVAAPPSAPSAPNNPKLASSAQRKASPQRSHLDKRITSQARSRNDFFNLIKKQTTANSSSTTPNPDPIVSSTSPQKSEELLITESGAAVASPQGSNHAIHLSDANGLKWAATKNGGDDMRINGNVCREETNQGYADNGGVEKPSSLDAFVYADDKEVAFLRSLGWDENAVEEGLTAEEINSFYECKELTPSLKLSRLQLVLGPQERSASFGSSSCDSE